MFSKTKIFKILLLVREISKYYLNIDKIVSQSQSVVVFLNLDKGNFSK